MTCEFEGCDRPAEKRSWCVAHYQQWIRNTPLRPLRKRRVLHSDEVGRVCTTCDQYKTWSHFYARAYGVGVHAVCKECSLAYDRRAKAARKGSDA